MVVGVVLKRNSLSVDEPHLLVVLDAADSKVHGLAEVEAVVALVIILVTFINMIAIAFELVDLGLDTIEVIIVVPLVLCVVTADVG